MHSQTCFWVKGFNKIISISNFHFETYCIFLDVVDNVNCSSVSLNFPNLEEHDISIFVAVHKLWDRIRHKRREVHERKFNEQIKRTKNKHTERNFLKSDIKNFNKYGGRNAINRHQPQNK